MKLILKTVENIDWYTPIEKLQLMYKVININENNRYSKYLKSFVMKFIDSKSYEELNESLENRFDIKIEEIDKTYYYLNELIKHFIKNNEFINDIQKIFVCPECFFAINVQEILQKTNDLTNEELYQKILYSYDGTCNVFFDCCKYYFYEYSNKIPNKNDLVDLMHSIYLINKACYMITNDKKLTRICKKGGKINTMIVKDFEETFNKNIGT